MEVIYNSSYYASELRIMASSVWNLLQPGSTPGQSDLKPRLAEAFRLVKAWPSPNQGWNCAPSRLRAAGTATQLLLTYNPEMQSNAITYPEF